MVIEVKALTHHSKMDPCCEKESDAVIANINSGKRPMCGKDRRICPGLWFTTYLSHYSGVNLHLSIRIKFVLSSRMQCSYA